MKASHTLWNFLDSVVFHSRVKSAIASISLIAVVQLVFSALCFYYLYDISSLSLSSENMNAIASNARWGMIVSVAGLVIVVILCLVLWKMLNYLVTKPMEEVNAMFKQLAEGHVDWSQDVDDLPYPEFCYVAKGYNTIMANIRKIIEDIRKAGIRIAIGSAHVLKSVDLAREKTKEQKNLSEQVAVSSSDGNVAINEISENANYVSENTGENLNKVRSSFQELETVASKVESINQTVTSFGDTIDELNRNSASIMDIIALINDMSDQTNLLSLNATIEAARAGEHGKGFAVVAEEVRNLAKQIKPATEDISQKINNMIATVDKTKTESDTIINASMEVNSIINETAVNFESMIHDFEGTNEQLLKIAAAIEELSLTNNEVNQKVASINTLSSEVATDMETSEKTVTELTEITEVMQETVARYRTGHGALDKIIPMVRGYRDHIQDVIHAIAKRGINVFDENYKLIPNTSPQKYTTAYTDAIIKELQQYVDTVLKEIPGGIYSIPVDRKGYIAVHHSQVSKPMTGNYDVDLVQSRNQRFFFTTKCDVRRATSTAPMLFQTYMRDTGEVMNDLSMPITVNGRHWGGFIVGLKPETFTEE